MVSVEGIEKTAVRDFGFCAHRESPVSQVGNGSGTKNAARTPKGGALAYTESDLEVQNENPGSRYPGRSWPAPAATYGIEWDLEIMIETVIYQRKPPRRSRVGGVS